MATNVSLDGAARGGRTGEGVQGFAEAEKKRNGAAGGVRVRTVALPNEHGGWGLSLEPVVLGLLVAPTLAGAGLAVATVGAFLARHPLKIAAADRRRGRRFPRTPVAERFALIYGAVALAGILAACAAAPSWSFLLPLALAAPFAAVQLAYDLNGESRALLPELAGATALASVAARAALAGGWGAAAAFGLWAVLAARVVPTILYVRSRLVRLHGGEAKAAPVVAAHALALCLVTAVALVGAVTWLAPIALLILLARSLYGFAERGPVTAKRIGIRELVYGAITVFALAAGYWWGGGAGP